MSTLNKTGEWILIRKGLNLEVPMDRLSIWYAKPKGQYIRGHRRVGASWEMGYRMADSGNAFDGYTIQEFMDLVWKFLNGKDITPKTIAEEIAFHIEKYGYTKDDFVSVAEIITPYGPVTIYPEEYTTVDLEYALTLVDEGSHLIRYMNNDGAIRDQMKNVAVKDKVFYLQSRGIGYSEAMKMVSGDIKSQHLMYFDPLPQYIHQFERGFIDIAKRKVEYCQNNGLEQLLEYESDEDGNFTLTDYINHLESRLTA